MNVFCLLTILGALCHSAFAVWPETQFQAVNYLLRYGYLNADYSMRSNPSTLLYHSVKDFQKKAILRMTGHLDTPTMHQMQKKRCGVPDVSLRKFQALPELSISISRRDASQVKWNKTDLTFFIKEYTTDIGKEATDETIADALKIWSDVSRLTFRQVNSEPADIIVKFASGEHGDGVPFDGPGGTLAHAYFPETNTDPLEGDAHFDNDETWTLENKPNGTLLFCTAVHEFGHSLGLTHTYSSKDIMFPYETDCYPGDFRLSDSDIYNIQQLYGKPDGTVTTHTTTEQTTPSPERPSTTERPTTPRVTYTDVTSPSTTFEPFEDIPTFPDLCKGHIDAITVGADGNKYVFIGTLLFLFGSFDALGQVHPLPIPEVFPEGPETVDSAFTAILDNDDDDYYYDYGDEDNISFTYLIQGRKIWKYYFNTDYQDFQLADEYPRNKRKVFPKAPSSIQAAFYMDGKTYLLFDHNSYIEYDYDREQSSFKSLEHTTSIRSLEYLKKLPGNSSVDAVCADDARNLNLFVQDHWYIVDHDGFLLDKVNTPSFFGCDVSNQSTTPSVPHWHRHTPHKHSPHKHHKHSPHKHHKHSPHKHKHSPHKHKHSPHKHHKRSPKGNKHLRKKDKKKAKRDRHRRKSHDQKRRDRRRD